MNRITLYILYGLASCALSSFTVYWLIGWYSLYSASDYISAVILCITGIFSIIMRLTPVPIWFGQLAGLICYALVIRELVKLALKKAWVGHVLFLLLAALNAFLGGIVLHLTLR